MYHVKCKSFEEAQQVRKTIQAFLDKSRFTANLTIEAVAHRAKLNFDTIRLQVKKGYCGNHAGACRLTGKKHSRAAYLEGLDWISFNDMVNDALDSISHEGDALSSICVIRKGKNRRMGYYGISGGEFYKHGDVYENHCGKPPVQSEYHQGTPGIFGWKAECVEEAA